MQFFHRGPRRVKLLSGIVEAMIRTKASESVSVTEQQIPSRDAGRTIRVKIYKPKSITGKLPPMLYTHGGGYISGSPDVFDGLLSKFVDQRPCVIVAPAYRNALIKPYPAAFNDCYDTLLWMRDNADELGIDASKFIIGGHSAGGGLTAAITLKVRDTKDVNVAFQMPFYPMIDDQQPSDPARYIKGAGWDSQNNFFGWSSYLKDLYDRNEDIPIYAAPARNKDYSNLPPTITLIGTYDPFYRETVEYVDGLRSEGIDVAFKIYERCPHGPEIVAPDSPIGKDGTAFTFDSYAEFYDRYIG